MALFLAAACQPAEPVATPVGSTGSPPPGTLPPGATATVEPGSSASAGDFEIGPGTFFLADPRVGLDDLAGYTETLTVSFDGTADGQARTWSTTYRLQHTADPTVSVLTVAASGDIETPDPAAIAEGSGAVYQRMLDGSCSARPIDPESSILTDREPAGLLPGVVGAAEAGSDTTNGVAASHYTFDERALLEPGIDTTGEMWVASLGGQVLRFLRSTTADAAYFGDGLDGKMTWDYELTDINALTGVALPEGCQLNAPIMAGASNVLVLPRYAGFDTQSSVADVVAYYEAQLPTFGWTFKSEPFIGDDRAVVEFTQGVQTLSVLITPGDNGLRVDLVLSGGE